MPRTSSPRFTSPTKTVKRHLKNHFIPHKGNNYHPHVLRHRVLFGFSVLLILMKVLVVVCTVSLPSSSLFASGITPVNIISLTNQTRQNLSLPVLHVNDTLMKAAQEKAQDMVAHQYFSHTSPDGSTLGTWIGRVGYNYLYAGENLAVHFDSAEGVSDGWLASPSHRKNIVSSDYTQIGVGVATGEFEGVPSTFVVQFFGQPVSPENQAVITKPSSKPTATISTNEKAVSDELTISAAPNNPASPKIHDTTLAITEQKGEYNVHIAVDNATSVQGQVAGQEVPFTKSTDTTKNNQWVAIIPIDTKSYGSSGEDLVVVAGNQKAPPVSKAVAILAPSTTLANLYTFNEEKSRSAQFFGWFTVHNLEDGVKRFYIYFIVFLGATFLLNVFFIKLRMKHPTVLAHTFAVIILALLLYLI